MTPRNHLLSFPVRDASDLRRAIQHASKVDDPQLRRHVTGRARALGHTDMLPSWWNTSNEPERADARSGLDRQFDQLSQKYDISVAKLKTVYLRGVEEFQETDIEIGSATMYGLARVQRFVNAIGSHGPFYTDEDLVTEVESNKADPGLEISVNSGMLVSDVLYASGASVARLFSPGVVRDIQTDGLTITVSGTLDNAAWTYTLDTTTGAHDLHFC